jgi:hypothetical protein
MPYTPRSKNFILGFPFKILYSILIYIHKHMNTCLHPHPRIHTYTQTTVFLSLITVFQ